MQDDCNLQPEPAPKHTAQIDQVAKRGDLLARSTRLLDRQSRLTAAKQALLESRLRGKGLRASASSVQRITRRPEAASAPPSFAQQRLWFLDQLLPDTSIYTIPRALRLSGQLNVAAVEACLQEIIRRHEVLRTTFAVQEKQPVQVINSFTPFILPFISLLELPINTRQTCMRKLINEAADQPFDLSQGPLLRVSLLHMAEEEYVLVLTLHHIISDEWSMGILVRELSVLYGAFSAGKPSPLPDLPIQYADFAVWQRKWLQGRTLEEQTSYWTKKLAGASNVLELPADRPRPSIQTFQGASLSLPLPLPLTEALKLLSHKKSTTLFMTFLAAFKVLLYRYTEQEDIIVGAPIANRTRSETEGLIGFFVNTLALRTDLSGNPTFLEVLDRVQATAIGAYTHQDLPFEKLVEELQPARDLSRNPLVQVMFDLAERSPHSLLTTDEHTGLTVSSVESVSRTAKCDFYLSIEEKRQQLVMAAEYNTDLFDAGTITRLLTHFRTLLTNIVSDPEQRIATIPIIPESEWQQLLVEWNKTPTAYPEGSSFQALFEQQVEQTPDAMAISCGETGMTYRELNQQANQLARYLQRLGAEPEVLVGMCMERCSEMIIGLLAILKAGAAYVPLDPTYPGHRLAFMLSDASPSILLTQQRLLSQLPMNALTSVLCLDGNWEGRGQESTENLNMPVTGGNLAYVIYTSGSTGRPKGVEVSQQALGSFLQAIQGKLQLTPEDRWLAVTSLSFDIAALEFFLPLTTGGCLILTPDKVVGDGAALLQLLEDSQASIMQATPITWQLLLAAGWKEGYCLEQILCGGETFPPNLRGPLRARARRLWNLYGPTEATIWATAHEICADEQRSSVPLGRPLANTRCYILDTWGQPVPVGIAGELYLGGDGLARDYLNHPDLTAERFIPHPFSQFPGERLYHTGDLARYLPDGAIEHLGRIDYQVKLRGFRIELGEIEAVLGQHPAIRSAVAVVREDQPGDRSLVVYLVPHLFLGEDPAVSVSDLRKYLQAWLPTYMVPSAFVWLEAFPLTSNGKVDRRALPIPERGHLDHQHEYSAPRTPVEQKLADLWAELFQLERVGTTASFFDLGGHSILALRHIEQIRTIFQVQLPLRTLFEYPTIASLALEVVQKQLEQYESAEIERLLAAIEGSAEAENK